MISVWKERAEERVVYMRDRFGRKIDYMRISVTDRCNLRCRYCMPEGIQLLPEREILSYEELCRICKAAAELGITRFKITGGEPLVRLGCPELIGMIKRLPKVEQVTLTTNGILLDRYLDELVKNGLDAVNISLDTLDQASYKQITGFDELLRVKENIGKAAETGIRVKINSVLQWDAGEKQWTDLAVLAKDMPVDVRFIEMMPIGYGRKHGGISGSQVLRRLREAYPGLWKDASIHGNGPAVYYRIPGFLGSIGFINAVHGRFCNNCNRIRLTAKGELKPCLCYETSVDLKRVLRSECGQEETEQEIKKAIRRAVSLKPQMHCFDMAEGITEKRQMVQIGG